MLLSATFLSQVANVNSFSEVPKIQMTEGDTIDVYLMLKDMSVNPVTGGFNPPGRRYIPAAGAMLMVTIDSIDDSRKVVKYATQPYSQDPSIWRFQILPTDKVVGTQPIKLILNESGKMTNGLVLDAVDSHGFTGTYVPQV